MRLGRKTAVALSATICALPAAAALWAWTSHWEWQRLGAYAHNSFPMNKLAWDLTLVTVLCVAIVAIAWLPKSKRRWLRFSLRTLLCLVTLCAAMLGWWSWQFGWVRHQARTIRAITELGGKVTTEEGGPAWAHRLLAKEWFVRATEAYLPTTAPEPVLQDVWSLRMLRRLDLAGTGASDATLARVGSLGHLRDLDVGRTPITDEGLRHLARLRKLESLRLDSTGITDAGVKELTGLTELRRLDLGGTKITDRALRSVKQMVNLESLHLDTTEMTDAGVENLTGLTNLVDLSVAGTRVTEAGVRRIQRALPDVWVSTAVLEAAPKVWVCCLAACPTRGLIACGWQDGTVGLWDAEARRLICKVKSHQKPVTCMQFSPDGKTLATGSEDRTIKLWDISGPTIKIRRVLNAGEVWSLAISPDGKVLAEGSFPRLWAPTVITLWDLASGQIKATLHHEELRNDPYYSLAFSTDGKTLAGGHGGGAVVLWDVEKQRLERTWQVTNYQGGVWAPLSPDASVLATGSYSTPITLWDAATGRLLAKLPGPRAAIRPAFSPHSKWLAAIEEQYHRIYGMQSVVLIWNLDTPQATPVTLSAPMRRSIRAVEFSPDGRLLVGGCDDGALVIWEVPTAPAPQ